ncbi:MAG: flippase-like domain-containing protein [Planctomycetaceae bacterium]|jgi:uncharacterized membrane protein YbhN (UPF0104 family)|nr:flippase-like domain-containing protein [Planctomycetaceae bacterium]
MSDDSEAPAPRSRRRQILSLSCLTGLLGWMVVWGYLHRDDFQQLLSFHPWSVIEQLPLAVISIVLIGMLNYVAARGLKARIGLAEWVRVTLAANLANYLFPFRAGMILRAAYLKNVHNLAISQFSSITGCVSVLMLLIASAVGSVIMLGKQTEGAQPTIILSSVFNLTVVGCLTLWGVSLFPKRLLDSNWIPESVKSFGFEMGRLGALPRVLTRLICLEICLLAISSIRLYLSASAVGWHIGPLDCTLVACILSISIVVAITPAGLGVQEAIGVVGSTLIGLPPEVSLAALLVNRGVSMVVTFTLGPFALSGISRRLKISPKRTTQENDSSLSQSELG